MKTYRLKGYVEVQFTVEVDADNETEAHENAYEYIAQDKLDAIHIEGVNHLQLLECEEI